MLNGTPAFRSRSAFTFVEVLFAVMILGIGFILIAGVFPVAISQTQSNGEETAAASVARNAVNCLSQVLTADDLPMDTGAVRTLESASPVLWERVRGNLIGAADPRYAWVPLVRRDEGATVAQVWVVVVCCRNRAAYDPAMDLFRQPSSPTGAPATLEARPVTVTLKDGGDSADLIRIEPAGPGASAAAPGAFVVIANDRATGEGNGRAYRLGSVRDEASRTWELVPGNDMRDERENLEDARALIVGRGYADPAHPDAGYAGAVQDVAVYTTYVPLR